MKKLLALTMALVMVLTLAACGGKTDAPGTSAPPEVTPADESLPADGSGTESEAPAGAGDEEDDPLLLSFSFPNAGARDNGTNNPPQYIVTLHGGAEVELQPGVERQLIKLDGFGKTLNVSSRVELLSSNYVDTLEIELSPSLMWSDIEAVIRDKMDIRDDVVFVLLSFSGAEECFPQEFASVSADDGYGHGIMEGMVALYNPTEDVLPFAECAVAAVCPELPGADGEAGDYSTKTVYEYLGEPACAQLIWDESSKKLISVNYYWVCDGFYARYSNQATMSSGGRDGSSRGVLWYFIDTPVVVEHYLADVTAFLAE